MRARTGMHVLWQPTAGIATKDTGRVLVGRGRCVSFSYKGSRTTDLCNTHIWAVEDKELFEALHPALSQHLPHGDALVMWPHKGTLQNFFRHGILHHVVHLAP